MGRLKQPQDVAAVLAADVALQYHRGILVYAGRELCSYEVVIVFVHILGTDEVRIFDELRIVVRVFEKFVANAPEKVVAIERKKQSDAQEKIDAIKASIAALTK